VRAGIIGINIRPLRTTIALADLDTRFIAQEAMATGDDESAFIDELTQRVIRLMKSHPELAYEGIGMALPGRIDAVSNKLVFAPNLKWNALDIKTPLERATKLPVEMENAANACALAELWSGRHGESIRNLVAVTISEGIGVGMILSGQLVRGSNGMAGEFGHVSVQELGPICKCGNRGCWEVCGSNSAAIRYYLEATSKGQKKGNCRSFIRRHFAPGRAGGFQSRRSARANGPLSWHRPGDVDNRPGAGSTRARW